MSCDFWRSRLIELARGILSDAEKRNGVLAHATVCRNCSLFLKEQRAFTSAAAELAARTTMAPPADLEYTLLAEFDSARLRRRRYFKPAAAIGALAAALACFAMLLAPSRSARLQPPVRLEKAVPLKDIAASPPVAVVHAPKPAPRPARRALPPRPIKEEGPFTAIPYTVPLDPRERVTVMRVDMPVAALMAVGLTAAVPDPAASAQADVVVGEDGRIRAIRLVSFNSSDRRVNQ